MPPARIPDPNSGDGGNRTHERSRLTVWGVDWSTKDIAIGVHGEAGTHCGVAFSRGDGPVRLLSLFARTRELAQATVDLHGPPGALYFETAFGDRGGQDAMFEASGVVKCALWSVLHDKLGPSSFHCVGTVTWRSWAGLKPIRDKDVDQSLPRRRRDSLRQRMRKQQQREFAARYVDVTSLTEHECDAVALAVAAASRGVQLEAA